MAKGMKIIAWLSLIATIVFLVVHQIKPHEILFTIVVTTATTSYHFWMRLFVGGVFDLVLNNKVDYNRKWFRVGTTEQKLYKIIRVKKWKKYLPNL